MRDPAMSRLSNAMCEMHQTSDRLINAMLDVLPNHLIDAALDKAMADYVAESAKWRASVAVFIADSSARGEA